MLFSIRSLKCCAHRVAACWCLCFASAALSQQTIRYPSPESDVDARTSYPLAVLNLCVNRLKGQYVLTPTVFRSQQQRSVRLLMKGEGLDVLWAVGNAEREEKLLRVPIPIDRGLIGWRLLLIKSDRAEAFRNITELYSLAQFYAGQGHDWPDVEVMRANHLPVLTSTKYESLFSMLAAGHIHYFPRSVSEVWPELEARPSYHLTVQPTLALHYPQALYFFVNRDNKALADQLTMCLMSATDDGSLLELFYEYYRKDIERSALSGRNIIELKNPLLMADNPIADKFLFSPDELPVPEQGVKGR